MALEIEGISPSIGSSIEKIALPFDTTERVQMTVRTAHDVVKEKMENGF